ncbi:hypothetical protein [Hydrogenivirga sp. 128-5-R1-1]|uniref:hypothetical protein n=1 Tax=Hydrogenivirga sp. 128-5-R1-1 TaxID=392423 RepID=UPI00015EF7EE|nr:hypothetical protein [Hydrogenivirga sp. 128-5-R1-1]EDP74896.1 hypothetical protein HG1285_13547 [Hydrogenivirga sp. 128-5-R1-1]
MLRYLLYVALVFLLADHVFTHWGPEIINWLASQFLGREVVVVEEAPYRESLIDKVVHEVRDKLERARR